MKFLTKAFRMLKEIVVWKPRVLVPDKCGDCKWGEYLDEYDNGLPQVYCNRFKNRIVDYRLERPLNGRMFNQVCSDFEPKTKKK